MLWWLGIFFGVGGAGLCRGLAPDPFFMRSKPGLSAGSFNFRKPSGAFASGGFFYGLLPGSVVDESTPLFIRSKDKVKGGVLAVPYFSIVIPAEAGIQRFLSIEDIQLCLNPGGVFLVGY